MAAVLGTMKKLGVALDIVTAYVLFRVLESATRARRDARQRAQQRPPPDYDPEE